VIADPHGRGVAIALEVIERLFGYVAVAVEVIEDSQRSAAAFAVGLLQAVGEPPDNAPASLR